MTTASILITTTVGPLITARIGGPVGAGEAGDGVMVGAMAEESQDFAEELAGFAAAADSVEALGDSARAAADFMERGAAPAGAGDTAAAADIVKRDG